MEVLAANLAEAGDARRACDGATVVYHCANPPYARWPELHPPLMRAIIEGASSAGADSNPEPPDYKADATARVGSICETCAFFQTSIEFSPTVQRQHDHAVTKNQTGRQHLFDQLLAAGDRDAS